MDNNENKKGCLSTLSSIFFCLYLVTIFLLYLGGLPQPLYNFTKLIRIPIYFLFLPGYIIASPFYYFFVQINDPFKLYDLLARYFGAFYGLGTGLLCSIIALMCFGIIKCIFSHKNNDIKDCQEPKKEEETIEKESKYSLDKTNVSFLSILDKGIVFILCYLLWAFLTILILDLSAAIFKPLLDTLIQHFSYIVRDFCLLLYFLCLIIISFAIAMRIIIIHLDSRNNNGTSFVGYILLIPSWIILTVLASIICGAYLGYCMDVNYASFFSADKNALKSHFSLDINTCLTLFIILTLQIWMLVKSAPKTYSKRYRNIRFYTGIVLILLPIFITCIGTAVLCHPAIPYKDKELECGVYLYTNDTAYNVAWVNIYSSRCGGFSHSGFCLITKDPRGENAQRQKLGLKSLRFTKLQRGYYVNMLSMAVPDQDGFTNYQSRCYPQENAYDFDVAALKNYLAGHSPNDLPAPALRMKKLSTDDYRKTWNRIVEFGTQFDKQFPNGMVYSPVPYTDKNVKTINCNTFSGAILDILIKEKLMNADGKQSAREFEKLINPRISFGGQTLADGQKLNEFLAQNDAPEQVARHWEFVKTAPLSEQNFWANVLRPDGSYGKRLSGLVEKPKD